MGTTILRHNKAGDFKINFKALALGDPMLNVEYQFPTYPDTL